MPKIQAPSVVAHRELRRQQLMAAALELAMNEGAGAITVAAVAAKAGLARSSVYEYFESSADLVADLVIEELDYYTDRLAVAIKDLTDPFDQIEQWIAEGLRYVADGRHMLVKSLNTIQAPDYRKEEIALGHRKMMAPLRKALTDTTYEDYLHDRSDLAFDMGPTHATDYSQASLRNYLFTESPATCYTDQSRGGTFSLGASVGALAIEILTAISGPQSIMAVEALGARGQDFPTAFKNVYGISWSDASTILSKVLAAEYESFAPPPN